MIEHRAALTGALQPWITDTLNDRVASLDAQLAWVEKRLALEIKQARETQDRECQTRVRDVEP